MKGLIKRQDAIDAINRCMDIYINNLQTMIYKADAYKALADLPSAQTDVPDRKVGKWIKHKDRASWYCSECTTDDYYAYAWDCNVGEYELQDSYCPNCGARMEGEEDETD